MYNITRGESLPVIYPPCRSGRTKNRNRQIPESVSSTSEFVLTVKVMNFSLIIYLDVFKTILCFVCKIYAVTPEPEYSQKSNTEPTRLDMLI